MRTSATGRHQLILAAAIAPDEQALAAWQRWRAAHEVGDTDGEEARLLPVISDRMDRLDHHDPGLDRIRGLRRFVWAQSTLLRGVLTDTLPAMEAAGIDTLVFKGAALLDAYPHSALRSMSDADVLVHPDDRLAALARLEEEGFEPLGGLSHAALRRLGDRYPGYGLADPGGRSIDLHWQPLHHVRAGDASTRLLWSHSRRDVVAGIELRRPAPEHHLVLVLGHGLRQRSGASLISLVDAMMIADRWRPNPTMVAELAGAYGLTATIASALRRIGRVSARPELAELAGALPVRPRAVALSIARSRGPGVVRDALDRIAGVRHPRPASLPAEPMAVALGQPLDLGDADLLAALGDGGWWVPEHWGAWTAAKRARIRFRLTGAPAGERLRLDVWCHAFTTVDSPRQAVDVVVDGKPVCTWQFEHGDVHGLRSVALPAAAGPPSVVTVAFVVHHPCRPYDQFGDSDERPLGLGVSAMCVVVGNGHHPDTAPGESQAVPAQ